MRIEAGRFRGRPLPRARAARPVGGRLRSSLFGVLDPRLPGARVLDLFAGVGALGLEALSRGAACVVLVERDRRAAAALREWLADAGAADQGRVVCRDATRGPLPDGPFDLVFLDPPFALWERSAAREVLARAVAVLAPEGRVACKLPARTPVAEDARWRLVRRRAVGSAAWALLATPSGETDVGDGPSSGGGTAPMQELAEPDCPGCDPPSD